MTHTGNIDGFGEVPKRRFLALCLPKSMGRDMFCDVSGAGAGKTQARTCANAQQRRSLRCARPLSSQNAVRRVVQKTGGPFSSSTFHVRNYALAVARCSFWQIILAGFASAGMFILLVIYIYIYDMMLIVIRCMRYAYRYVSRSRRSSLGLPAKRPSSKLQL